MCASMDKIFTETIMNEGPFFTERLTLFKAALKHHTQGFLLNPTVVNLNGKTNSLSEVQNSVSSFPVYYMFAAVQCSTRFVTQTQVEAPHLGPE